MGKTIHELAAMDPKELLAQSQAAVSAGADPKAGVRSVLAASSAKKLRSRLDEIFAALGIDIGDA
ncbi:hypothetical protein D3C84_1285080 [compost metagenome]